MVRRICQIIEKRGNLFGHSDSVLPFFGALRARSVSPKHSFHPVTDDLCGDINWWLLFLSH